MQKQIDLNISLKSKININSDNVLFFQLYNSRKIHNDSSILDFWKSYFFIVFVIVIKIVDKSLSWLRKINLSEKKRSTFIHGVRRTLALFNIAWKLSMTKNEDLTKPVLCEILLDTHKTVWFEVGIKNMICWK